MNLEEFSLEELCIKITDGSHSSPKTVDSKFKMGSVKDMTRFGITLDSCRTISELDYNELVKNGCKPQFGDVLIAKDGATCLETVCVVDKDSDYVLLSSVAILRPNEKIRSNFLRYSLENPSVRKDLKDNYVSGSAIPRVVLKDFRRFKLRIPPIEYQDKAIKILKSLDDKIELNNQMNETLEAMARAIFKEWFIDFGPVRAKAEGRRPYGMDHETAALFPDSFEESELGMIPKGWRVLNFKEIIETYKDNRGKTPPTQETGIPLIEIKHLEENRVTPNLKNTKYVSNEIYNSFFRAYLEEDDILISTVGTIGRTSLVKGTTRFAIGQNILGIKINKKIVDPYFQFYLMKSSSFLQEIDKRLIITVQASIKRKDLETILCLIPSIEIQKEFTKKIDAFLSYQVKNLEESETLMQTRDCLLPRLISGEIGLGSEHE